VIFWLIFSFIFFLVDLLVFFFNFHILYIYFHLLFFIPLNFHFLVLFALKWLGSCLFGLIFFVSIFEFPVSIRWKALFFNAKIILSWIFFVLILDRFFLGFILGWIVLGNIWFKLVIEDGHQFHSCFVHFHLLFGKVS